MNFLSGRHLTVTGLLIVLTCLLGGCGGSDVPAMQRLPADAVILAFGDSLTRGTGADPGQSYPDFLAASSGRTVVNAGIPGELSAQGLKRLPGLLAEHQPDLVILCHGGNDLLQKRDHGSIRANLVAMINLARDNGAAVVLIGVPEPGLLLSTAPYYQEVANEFGLLIDNDSMADILSDPSLKADAAHPNGAGYQQLASNLGALLTSAGAL